LLLLAGDKMITDTHILIVVVATIVVIAIVAPLKWYFGRGRAGNKR